MQLYSSDQEADAFIKREAAAREQLEADVMDFWIEEQQRPDNRSDAIATLFPGKRRQKPTREDWERAFKQQLNAYLISVPQNFYDERLYSDEPDYVQKVFTNLEEDNLTIVEETQDVEQMLEQKRALFKLEKSEMEDIERNLEETREEERRKLEEVTAQLEFL